MASIYFYPATDRATTDANGVGSFVTKIPGTFSGIDGFSTPTSNGRYLRHVKIWSESNLPNDRIANIRIEDIDGVIPIPIRALLPSYPVVQYLEDRDIAAPSTAISGMRIPANQMVTIEPIDPIDRRGLKFIPAGLYICADFYSGDGSANKSACINYIWGKYQLDPGEVPPS